jgi:tetratricopeptide (TPR) repeat protein
MKLGDRFAAKEAFARAVKIGKKAWRPDHFLVAQYFNNLGNVLQDEGDLSGAKSAMEEAVRIARKVLPDDHPERAVQVFNLGTVLERTGDLRGARNALNEAVEAFMHSLGPGDPRTQLAQQRLAGLGQQLTTQKQDTPG